MGQIRDYLRRGFEALDLSTPRKPLMKFWVFLVRSKAGRSHIVMEEETLQEAVDQLPTHDSFYTRDQLREMKYTISFGKQIVRQTWSGPDGFRMYLDFYLSDSFDSMEDARKHIFKMGKEGVI